jgi:hypothetical protein
MVAWLRDLVSSWSAAFCLDEGPVHQLLHNDEHGVAAHASTIWTTVSTLFWGACWRSALLTEREHAQWRPFGCIPPPNAVGVFHFW